MDYLPPLRNYRQMVRVVKDDADDSHMDAHLAKQAVNFKLGNAFGDHEPDEFDAMFSNGGVSPTELKIRTLDSMNLPSSSLRRPGITGSGGILPTRSGSSLFHDLNESTRDYLNGMDGGQALSRHDAGAGTKFRTQLSPDASNKVVYQHDAFTGHNSSRGKNTHSSIASGHESHFPDGFDKSKKHRSASHPDATFS